MVSTHTRGANPLESTSNSAGDSQAYAGYANRAPLSRLFVACLFWLLCLTLTAAGHRLYMAIKGLDREVSSVRYMANGAPLAWVGHGSWESAYERVTGVAPTNATGPLHTLPTSYFWLGSAVFFAGIGGLMAWVGRYFSNQGIQSLIGLFAGHFLWLGAIELGLDSASRRLGLAGSLDVVEGRAVGTHGGGILIQLSAVFLFPMLVGLAVHESNRCALFYWFRKRLPIVRTASAGGRVENYAARTTTQYFMTVWFCYVSVLWLADPISGAFGQISLLVVMIVIGLATPYMIWRTMRQASIAGSLRYSVSGAIVAWTAVEIAAAMQLFNEPWLSNSFSTGIILAAMTILLTGVTVGMLLKGWPTAVRLQPPVTSLLMLLVICGVGCGGSSPTTPMTAEEIDRRLQEFDRQVKSPRLSDVDGLVRALGSNDPEMRAQAAIAFGKSSNITADVKKRLEAMAGGDESRLSQLAAMSALKRLGLLSTELLELLQQLGSDPEWERVAQRIID